ncbi:MAG: hypothetical protein A2Y56_12060 [Candidatus Aminicenantes bacterium RBG_13_63_10]|nr:MAG: hypothetical protein A2Y56_12060 [Candidatus Aminicenantes bacterium RBG_13_63_10]
MKRFFAIAGMSLLVLSAAQASILTNTNQSAEYIRMLSRNASTEIDAVYYNPAGLTRLKDGFHFSLNNQSIFQKKTVESQFPGMNESKFVGNVSAPLFPSLFLAYKTGKLVFSFGFGPNSGGGSADFSKGLPSFEWQLATVPTLMTYLMGTPVTAYRAGVAFKGSSMFLGYQLNAAYAVTDWMSVGLGGRLLSCSNSYEGSIQNMEVYVAAYGSWIPFPSAAAPSLPDLTDTQIKTEQTGTGFTPIISLNFLPMDGMNVSLKYEFKTKVELTNKTERDDLGMFPDGQKVRSDLPAMMSLGVGYAIMPKLRAMLSFNHWCDKNIDWDGDYSAADDKVNLKSNSWDFGIGVEYDLTDALLVSAGFLRTQMSPGDEYQTDLRHELSSSTIGLGARYKLSDKFEVNIGGIYGFYDEYKEDVAYSFSLGALNLNLGEWLMTYQRSNWAVSIGFNGRF